MLKCFLIDEEQIAFKASHGRALDPDLDHLLHGKQGKVTFTRERAENKAHVLKSRFCWERYLLVVTKLWTSLGKEIVRSDINPFV